ncbi:uncharacterized protein LOC107432931 [Ziziphus jujuba]|uniref:Uncharacterized protein LOC107432931 n=1 Tax=Ziziphus jujuba TaxID=326968 RepID=A0ABM3I6R3_ZIZJJ|nr:uncharacterized protein LOC107432931 [Ziziphus jujuba]
MKNNLKDLEIFHGSCTIRSMVWPLFIIIVICFSFSASYLSRSCSCNQTAPFLIPLDKSSSSSSPIPPPPPPSPPSPPPPPAKTNLSHIVFGIGASSKLWNRRKSYVKLWWRPEQMRGVVWLDKPVKMKPEEVDLLPPLKISGDTSNFKYSHPNGHRSAIRISRIVSETLRLGMKDVRWFVMGDDDTVFVADNLVRVLQKYDHNEFYYIGSSSESHVQNIAFSYNMAYGGGGIAISYGLAKEIEKMQDRCLMRYPSLYGSDDRLQACMAELGVPLTRERGFHQFDVYGNLFGLLAAHPVTPLVSIHHLDVVKPIFPNMGPIEAIERLRRPMSLDSAGLMQQSICYDRRRRWTVSVSWGFAVQIIRGFIKARDMEIPGRTMLNWYRTYDENGYPFNTRPFFEHKCQKPFVYYLSNAVFDSKTNKTITEYISDRARSPKCEWKMANPFRIQKVVVHKRPDPNLWDKSPRRNCCRILSTKKNSTLMIDVGVCKAGEVVEF